MRNDGRESGDAVAVRNAGDVQQVRRARRKDEQRKALLLTAIGEVMRTASGRLVMWDLLERAGIYRSIYSPGEEIRYLAGRQDFGHELLALLLETDEASYELMQREARVRKTRDQVDNEAAHTVAATTEDSEA